MAVRKDREPQVWGGCWREVRLTARRQPCGTSGSLARAESGVVSAVLEPSSPKGMGAGDEDRAEQLLGDVKHLSHSLSERLTEP